MDAERVEVLHVADGDAGVGAVAYDLVLDLLPAVEIVLNQHLADRAGRQTRLRCARQRRTAAGDAASGATQGEGGAHDHGQTDRLSEGQRVLDGGDRLAGWGGDV